jgi:integrase
MTTARGKITLKSLEGLQPRKIIWDGQLKGFGARRSFDSISFILMYRTREGRQRFYTIGKLGSPWSPERARDEALKLLYEVRAGKDPAADKVNARKGETVADLCKSYLEEIEAGSLRIRGGREKKPNTIRTDKSRIANHVLPTLGARKVASVTQDDIEKLMIELAHRTEKGKSTARRTIGMLGAIFQYAVKYKMRPDNPVRGIERFADNRRKRRMTEEEYLALGGAIRNSTAWPSIPLAAQFLALTGWRSSEVMNLRRSEVDFARRTATLGDTKTGASMRPLAHRAIEVLVKTTSGDLFFPSISGKVYSAYAHEFELLAPAPDVTPHVLRHSFASLANDLGFTDATVAAMLGHANQTMTGRYQHSADAVLLKAADTVADKTASLMGDAQAPAQVIQWKA